MKLTKISDIDKTRVSKIIKTSKNKVKVPQIQNIQIKYPKTTIAILLSAVLILQDISTKLNNNQNWEAIGMSIVYVVFFVGVAVLYGILKQNHEGK